MVVEQRVEKKRKIAESVWVHNVVTIRTDSNALYAKVASLTQILLGECTGHHGLYYCTSCCISQWPKSTHCASIMS